MTTADVIQKILDDEGGIADVGDGKGVTAFGQTPDWIKDNGFPAPTSRDQAGQNYAQWMVKTRLLDVCQIDGFIGWVVTDMAVHFGLSTAVKVLQRSLGVTADGVIGPQTLNALDHANAHQFARTIVAAKGVEYGRVLSNPAKDNRPYAKGWLTRLGRQIQALP